MRIDRDELCRAMMAYGGKVDPSFLSNKRGRFPKSGKIVAIFDMTNKGDFKIIA